MIASMRLRNEWRHRPTVTEVAATGAALTEAMAALKAVCRGEAVPAGRALY